MALLLSDHIPAGLAVCLKPKGQEGIVESPPCPAVRAGSHSFLVSEKRLAGKGPAGGAYCHASCLRRRTHLRRLCMEWCNGPGSRKLRRTYLRYMPMAYAHRKE